MQLDFMERSAFARRVRHESRIAAKTIDFHSRTASRVASRCSWREDVAALKCFLKRRKHHLVFGHANANSRGKGKRLAGLAWPRSRIH